MNTNYLTQEKIGKLLLKFSVPTIFALLISSLYNIVDQIFIGHKVGYLGNGATNVVFPITVIALAIALFIGDGSAAFLSICLGKKDYDNGAKSVGNASILVILSSILLLAICLVSSESIIWGFGATDNNIEYAREYFRYVIIGIPFFMFANCMNSVIRADGNPQFSMLSMVVGAIINVILDAYFILVLDWGMMGAGLATSLGQIVSALISFGYLFRMKSMTLKGNSFVLSRVTAKFLPLGISSFITQISIVVTMAVMNNALVEQGALSRFGSDIPLTAIGIVMKVFQIVIAFIIGVAVGAQPIVGFNLGAGRIDRVKELYKLVIKIEVTIGIISTLCFELFPTQILNIFGQENALYEEFGTMAFRIFLSTMIFAAVQKSSGVFLQSLGRPVLSMIVSLTRDFILIVPMIIIFTNIMGVTGAYYTAPAADIIAFIVTVFMMRYVMKDLDAQHVVLKVSGEAA